MKNLNDGVGQNDNLSLEAVRFAWGTTPIAWEKIRQPAAKNRLTLNVSRGNPESRKQNEDQEQWGLMESVNTTLTAVIKCLMIIAFSLSGGLRAWKIMATHFQPSNTREEEML